VRRLLLATLCLAAGVAPTTAVGAPYLPPSGKVFHSGLGGYGPGAVGDFTTQSGKHPAVFQYFISWQSGEPDLNFFAGLLRKSGAAGSRAMLSVSTSGTGLTPGAIARGRGDTFLVAMNRILAEHGQPTYLRLLSEMNNANNPYSAYDLSGNSRGRAFSTREFKRAWRRAALVLRGGDLSTVNSRLRRLGMPPVQSAVTTLERPAVALLWVPLTFGNPEIARNHPKHWWPGSGYVDWVGSTWYSPFPAASAFHRFMNHPLWRTKPFAFGEYGVWGAESPSFVRLFFRFVRSHPRVRMISYYQSALLKPQFRLSSHPRSRGELRRQLSSSRYVGYAPE